MTHVPNYWDGGLFTSPSYESFSISQADSSLTFSKDLDDRRPLLSKEGQSSYYKLYTKVKRWGDQLINDGGFKKVKLARYYNGYDSQFVEKVVLIIRRHSRENDQLWEDRCIRVCL